jgi:hypothetical protein
MIRRNSYVHFADIRHQLLNVRRNRKHWNVRTEASKSRNDRKYKNILRPKYRSYLSLSIARITINEGFRIINLCVNFIWNVNSEIKMIIICVPNNISLLYFLLRITFGVFRNTKSITTSDSPLPPCRTQPHPTHSNNRTSAYRPHSAGTACWDCVADRHRGVYTVRAAQ